MTDKNIMVSVCMITYNHENFISDAIEGVLKQKTNFPIELIIGEDCSTDNTRNIIIDYANNYPEIIKLLLPEKNLGMSRNFLDTMQAASGKYIAICEGDDFWTDPLKLQKQVDILEKENDVVAVVTNASVCDKNGNLLEKNRIVIPPKNKEGMYNLHDFFIKISRYPTLTVVFRNMNMNFIRNEIQFLSNPFLADWTLWVLLHTMGDFYYLDEVTASYRINPNSVTHSGNSFNRWKEDIVIRKKLIKLLPHEYHKYLKADAYAYHNMATSLRKQNLLFKSIWYYLRAFIYSPIGYFKYIRKTIKAKYK